MKYEERTYNEDGINWAWFTELTVIGHNAVKINKHYRLHKGEDWPQKCKDAPYSPYYHATERWKEGEGRIALEYRLPDLGWCKIVNPKYIFDYKEA